MGTATRREREAHKTRLRVSAAEEAEAARRVAERREKARQAARRARDRRDEVRAAAAEASAAQREDRARIAALFVASAGRPVTRAQLARAVGIGPRTLSRVTPLAIDRGWLLSGRGGFHPGPVLVPTDERRAEIEAAELATVGV